MTRAEHDSDRIRIDEVQLTAANAADRLHGLVGYLQFRINGALLVDGVTLRRTADGRCILSYPERRDRQGRGHALLRPTSDAVRAHIAGQVLRALGIEETPR